MFKNNKELFLSVVIPAYNEEKRIVPTLESVIKHLSDKPYLSEILVVDDGSTDGTCAVVREYAVSTKIPVRLLNGEPNHGKGYAVRRGVLAAKGHWKLFMDADGSVPITELDRFMSYGASGSEVVIGSIAHPNQTQAVIEHAGWHRRLFGSVSKFLVRSLATPGIYDTQRGFKLFSAKAANIIFNRQTIERFGFDIELIVIAQLHRFRIKELPVLFDNPDGSTVRLRDYWRTMKELAKIVANRSTAVYA